MFTSPNGSPLRHYELRDGQERAAAGGTSGTNLARKASEGL